MNLIVAVDSTWGIGKDGRLLFRIREDMKRFRRLTVGKTIVFGRKTMETFPNGHPLPDRKNIVMSRSSWVPPGAIQTCRSTEELFQATRSIPSEEVFIIGGESIYRQLLRYCEFAYVTRVEGAFDADAFFPDLDADNDWQITDPGELLHDGSLSYRWVTYRHLRLEEIPV